MKTRRQLVNSIASIGALNTILPGAWIKPVVNSVVLPSHAQTSEQICLRPSIEYPGNRLVNISAGMANQNSLQFRASPPFDNTSLIVDATVSVVIGTAPTDPTINFYLTNGGFIPTPSVSDTDIGTGGLDPLLLTVSYVGEGLVTYMDTTDQAILNFTFVVNYRCIDGSTDTTTMTGTIPISIIPF